MPKVINISKGPRGIHTADGALVMLEAGQSAILDLPEGETGTDEWFEIEHHPLDHDRDGAKGGSQPHDPPSLSGKNKAELLAIAAAEEVTEAVDSEGNAVPIDKATNDQIKAAIEAKRAA